MNSEQSSNVSNDCNKTSFEYTSIFPDFTLLLFLLIPCLICLSLPYYLPEQDFEQNGLLFRPSFLFAFRLNILCCATVQINYLPHCGQIIVLSA